MSEERASTSQKAQEGGQETRSEPAAPTLESIRRAVWAKASLTSWILKACVKDGSAVLARIVERPLSYDWEAGGQTGSHVSLYGAQRAARKAARQAVEGMGG